MFYAKENLGSQEPLHEWKSHYCSPPCTWVFYWNLHGIDCCRQFTCACFGDWAGGSSVHCQISSIVPLTITSLWGNQWLSRYPISVCDPTLSIAAVWLTGKGKWLVVKDFLGQRKMTRSLHTSFSVGSSVLCLHKRIWFEIICTVVYHIQPTPWKFNIHLLFSFASSVVVAIQLDIIKWSDGRRLEGKQKKLGLHLHSSWLSSNYSNTTQRKESDQQCISFLKPMHGWWEQLTETPDAYSGYVPMQYDDYLENMAKSAVYKPFAFVCSYCALDVLESKVDAVQSGR